MVVRPEGVGTVSELTIDDFDPVLPRELGRSLPALRRSSAPPIPIHQRPRVRHVDPHPLRRLRGDPAQPALELRPVARAQQAAGRRDEHARVDRRARLPGAALHGPARPHPPPQAGQQGVHAPTGRAAPPPHRGDRRRPPRRGRRAGRRSRSSPTWPTRCPSPSSASCWACPVEDRTCSARGRPTRRGCSTATSTRRPRSRACSATMQLLNYLNDLFEERRREPQDDLLERAASRPRRRATGSARRSCGPSPSCSSSPATRPR